MTEKIEFFPIVAGLEKIEPVQIAKEFNKGLYFEKEEFSIRSCPGVRDVLSTGYIIPLWQDLIIKYNNQSGIEIIPSGTMIDHQGQPFADIQFHGEKELAGYSFGAEYFNFSMKLRCPWYVRTAPNTSLLMIPCFYNENPHFTVASGITTSDVYPMLLAQIILRKFTGEITLKKGTPLFQLLAIKSQPQLKIHSDDSIIYGKVQRLKNWMYSKFHSTTQYRNIGKFLK